MMYISFQQSGGFMGRTVHLDLNVDDLPADEAATVRRLVEEADFFALPAQQPVPTAARDAFQYHINIRAGVMEHTIEVSDASMPDSLRPLMQELTRLARAQHR